jgi:hypothetical protein
MRRVPTERINVNFPKHLLEELRRYVPLRERSALIVRATERELRRMKLSAALKGLSEQPAWKPEQHPDLCDGQAVDRAVGESRAAWQVQPQERGDE